MKELTEPVRSHAFSQQEETVTSSLNLRFQATLNLEHISYLEREELELDEIISLIFLLYEDSCRALQELQNKLQDDSATVLLNWASNEENAGNSWQMKVIEALCVIKNYRILKKLGYSKAQIIPRYAPLKSNQATYINKLRKTLYIMCEHLNREKTELLLRHVSCFFLENNKEFTDYNREYLELYLLSWENDGFISETDVADFRRIIKLINEDDIYDMLNVELFEYQQIANDSSTLHYPKYYIDPNNPGVLLIINQEDFHTDVREERKHLLPSDTSRKLENRVGSQHDVDSLSDLFATKFGFKVIVTKNLFHNSTLKTIKDVVNSIRNESSLFVCILSHGNEGVVYGANSCRIRIGKIQSLMCKTNKTHLKGKPKVLIIQACQGVKCQKIVGAGQYASSTDTEDDDDKSEIMNGRGCVQLPRTIDLLTFWSTVPGYSTVRETETGSWFIQTLCKQLEEYGNTEHLLEICIRVIDEMANKTWISKEGVNIVVPLTTTTLRHRLYLPALKGT